MIETYLPSSLDSKSFSIQRGMLLEDDRVNFPYYLKDMENARKFLEHGQHSEIITYFEQAEGLVPMHAQIDENGIITYTPTFAVHGITCRPTERDTSNESTPFADVIAILKNGFTGNGSLNIAVYPPQTNYFSTADFYSEIDTVYNARFFLKFHKIYPTKIGTIIHRNVTLFDQYKSHPLSGENPNYAHFVKPEDISVMVVPTAELSEEKIIAEKLTYSKIIFEHSGKDIPVEVVNRPMHVHYAW